MTDQSLLQAIKSIELKNRDLDLEIRLMTLESEAKKSLITMLLDLQEAHSELAGRNNTLFKDRNNSGPFGIILDLIDELTSEIYRFSAEPDPNGDDGDHESAPISEYLMEEDSGH